MNRRANRPFPGGWLRCLAAVSVAMLVGLMLPGAVAAPLDASGYRMEGDHKQIRVVMAFDGEPEAQFMLLRAPHRLVIDLRETRLVISPRELRPHGLITGVRYGQLQEGDSRLILTAAGPFKVDRLDVVPNETSSGYRLVADLSASSEAEFEAALALQAETTGSTTAAGKSDRFRQPAESAADKRFTIVIDPGHGGIDGGAEGLHGTVEKSITLTFATELRDRLRAEERYEVFLTRDTDEFLRLDERVRIARRHAADLFISIHADTISLEGVRGATVYTISDKASDAEAQALADRENLSDQLAGIVVEEENHEVADILIDLIRRETHAYSIRFARSLVSQLSNRIGLINNPHRFAGFKVLKAPDVPSVLVELGYLSNAKDEAQLKSAEWRKQAADSIADAIASFASARNGAGG